MRVWVPVALLLTSLAGCTGLPDGTASSDAGFEDIDFDVEATDTTGVIRGVVVDEAIRPLGGVLINVTGASGNQNATTRDDGGFAFEGLEPGDYFLLAVHEGFNSMQAAATVVAGVDEPPLVKITLTALPVEAPYLEALTYSGFLTFGAAVGITSLGSTFFGGIGNDYAIWNVQTPRVPTWLQGELVWDQTQPTGGMMIWEIVQGGTNNFQGHRETAESPALAYWNTTVLQAQNATVLLEDGVDYRFFAGPHPALAPNTVTPPEDQCPWIPTIVLGDRNPCRFGFGLTAQQRADAYVHNFYGFAPPEGWRFTDNGDPVVPDA